MTLQVFYGTLALFIDLSKTMILYPSIKEILWRQFGASMDMLGNAISACPPEVWEAEDKRFWYLAYHTLFFLDFYLSHDAAGFMPPFPFTLSEFEDVMPERIYTQEELLTYLQYCREKCHAFIDNISDRKYWENESGTMVYPVVEILLYNMRHVQHHAAQLNLILRQETHDAPDWVRRNEILF